MNKWVGVGRITKDVELTFTQGKGTAVAKFTMAVDDGFGDKKETAFIPVVVWGKGGEAVANYTHKGSKVLVSGKIKTRSYEANDGSKRYVTEVVADMYGGVEFLDSKSGGGNTQSNNGNIPADYFGGGDMTPVDDSDEMPF